MNNGSGVVDWDKLMRVRDGVSAREPDVEESLILTVPNTIVYHRGVKAKDMPMDVTVEYDGWLICFYGPGRAIELIFELDELRAIMRLFDTEKE